uniref:Macrophage colony-stimulating factor 1 n=1 Tax=Geotrypetes seraphini TaxID=260995 RepID=A0A6P8NTI8_GEOSA|nr:macrophage colony-stimulating factor 1 [Geotrypetes seraphini]
MELSSSSTFQFIFSLVLATRLQATENIPCSILKIDSHLQFLDRLIDSQLQSSCTIIFDFVDPAQLTDEFCYVLLATEFLDDFFETHMKFKPGSLNYKDTDEMKSMLHKLQEEECIPTLKTGCCKKCAKTYTVSPQEMLEMVKAVIEKSPEYLQNITDQRVNSCMEQIEQCGSLQLPELTGPAQCDCSCPTQQNLLTTSSNWEHLPNSTTASSAAPTIMPASQGNKETSIPPNDFSDTMHTPVAISGTDFRASSSDQGSSKTPGESVNPSFILSPVTVESVPHRQKANTFSTEPPSAQFTLVIENQTTGHNNIWNTSSKNLISDGESVGITAMVPSVGIDSSQSHSSQPVFGSASQSAIVHRTSGKGSGDKVTAQKSLLSSVLQNNGPAVAPSRGTAFTASKKNEDPAKESRSPTVLTGLDQLIAKAMLPTKRHSSEFRSKGRGESAQSINEREENLAGPRSELYSFSVTDAGEERVQERLQPESQSSIVFSSVLPILAGLLLTLCGLLYYRHKSKLLQRMSTATLPEERPLNEVRMELQVQEIV